MLLQMQRLEAKEWLGANMGEGPVKPETVVYVWPKARPKRRNRVALHALWENSTHFFVGTRGKFQNAATMRLSMRFTLQ
jgi:hypothetical protein